MIIKEIDTEAKYDVTGILIPDHTCRSVSKQIAPQAVLTGTEILNRISQTEYVIAQLRHGMENMLEAPKL